MKYEDDQLMNPSTRSKIIQDLKSDNQEGFVAVYDKFYNPLFYFILGYVKNREVAEEILADVFVAVWKHRMGFKSLENLRAFIYVSAKNASLNSLRSKKQHISIESIADYEDIISEDKDMFAQMIYLELLQSVFEEVERLPAKQREVFNLTFLEDKTVEEIAQQLNMSPSSVYTNRFRAIQSLRLSLKIDTLLSLLVFLMSKF